MVRTSSRLAYLLLSALLFSPAYGADEGSLRAEITKAYAARSDVIFRGTLRHRGTSTIPADDVRRLAVVQLHEVISGPPVIRAFVGKDVTVLLREPSKAREGEERVYFSVGWKIGEDVAVMEMGSFVADAATTKTVAADVQRLKMLEDDRQLRARIGKAQMVVYGRVTALRATTRGKVLSEHDPEWTEANVEVEETLKGSPTKTIRFLFPASVDVMWYRVPKPKVGERGIWILNSELSGAPSPKAIGISAVGEFLGAGELSRVKKLLLQP